MLDIAKGGSSWFSQRSQEALDVMLTVMGVVMGAVATMVAGGPTLVVPSTPPTTTEPATDTTATAATAVSFPVTVEHALGETVVPAAPRRVVALDRSLIDSALALGLPLVGYTTYQDPDGTLPAYFGEAITEHAADAVWVGDLLSPNLEAIALLEPDLILTA
ncbi:MAG: hypothetical protein ACK5OX_04515, partial [Desertimonas sp.]